MNHSTSQNVLFDDEFLPCDDTFLFGDEKQISSFEEDNLINSNTAALPTTTASPTTTSANDIKTTTASSGLVVLLKQAKGREDQFEDHFPPSLLCHPYKYDLKIIGPGVENHRQHKLTLNLVDAETLVIPNVTLPNNKKILEAVAVEQVEELNSNERVIRFTFNLCSFHFKRRSFRLELTQTVDGNTKRLFLSDPFQTFARRREHHQSLGSSAKNEAKNHTVAAQTSPSLSTAPLTPDSSNNSSESSILSSPKSEKQGVKRSIASVNSSYYPISKSRTMQEPSSPTILNPSAAVPHYTTAGAAFNPYMFPANYAVVAAAYHQEMAQQFASMPLSYGTTAKMPMYYPPQWAAYQPQFVFGSPQSTSPISPPSNVIAHQEKTPDVLSALFDNTDKNKTKKEKQIHHTPLNFVQSQPEPTTERASLAIQLLKTLTPNERQAVNMFINSSSSNV